MNRVTHFEIPADDMTRATEFYKSVFNWEIKDSGMPGVEYLLITTGKDQRGIDGGMMKRGEELKMSGENAYVCTIEVDDIDSYIEKVKTHSGKILMDKVNIPGVGWFTYCLDTEGNKFSIMQPAS